MVARVSSVAFVAGQTGWWRIDGIRAISGDSLPAATMLDVVDAQRPGIRQAAAWTLRGVVSNARYATRSELDLLKERQPALGRKDSTRAVLIPIRKSPAWWALAQDERRSIMEERSRHVSIGLQYLPAIARQLLHSRDLGESFDFLTWFEFAPEDELKFDQLLERLRATEEWKYVENEVEIRLTYDGERHALYGRGIYTKPSKTDPVRHGLERPTF